MAGTQDHHVDESDRVYADLRGSRSLGDHVCGISSIDIRPYLHNGLIRSLQPSFLLGRRTVARTLHAKMALVVFRIRIVTLTDPWPEVAKL